MPPASPMHSKRSDPRNLAFFLISLALAATLCYKALQPGAGGNSMPTRVRVRLNLNSGQGGSSQVADMQGSEDQVRAAVAEALHDMQEREAAWRDSQLEEMAQQQQHEEQQQAARAAQGEAVSGRQDTQEEQQQAAAAQAADDQRRFEKFAAAAGRCYDGTGFDCLTKQADMEPGPGQFRFPHFFVVGFQKCATTSLFHHLIAHPQIEEPDNKEPEYFTKQCDYNAMRCRVSTQRDYMREILRFKRVAAKNFTTAGFEGSTHYVLEGKWLAGQLRDLFPWLRIIVSMRDPISQAIAMVFHNLDHGRLPHCFQNNRIFKCVYEDLDVESRYARSLKPWLKHFPREQLHLVQYENLTSDAGMRPVLRNIKRFLKIESGLPSDDLGLFNYRHQRKQTQGWPMTRQEYLKLVEKARRNAQEVAEIVREYGFGDPDSWMRNWERAWQENLDEFCQPGLKGECMVQVT